MQGHQKSTGNVDTTSEYYADHDSAQSLFGFVHWSQPQGGLRLALINLRHLYPVPICQGSLFRWVFRSSAGLLWPVPAWRFGTLDAVLFRCTIVVDAIQWALQRVASGASH